jgi:hypothetical protein
MATSSIFLDFTTPVDRVSILMIGKDIINGKYKTQVEQYRNALSSNKEEAERLKKSLPAFTPSGTFINRRTLDNLDMYSGFVHLDFDKLDENDIPSLKQKIGEISYTHLCFISPSGNGLKVFIEVNTSMEHHDIAYQQVKEHYEKALGIVADAKCKDITRLCFVSYDPDSFRTIENKRFIVDLPFSDKAIQYPNPLLPIQPAKELPPPANLDLDFKFNQMIDFTSNKITYSEGNRNNYIYQLASNCNRSGISHQDCEDLCIQKFDLKHSEIRASVKSAYTNHFAEYAKFANYTKSDITKKESIEKPIDDEDYLKSTPAIPDHIFDSLPDVLRAGCSAFNDSRRKDVFLISALSILSGCLPGVSGIYHGERVYPHLYTFVIAPAASGKGVLKNAKRLADKYHERVLKASRDAQAEFNIDLESFKSECRTKHKNDPQPEKPQEPKFRIVFIPADSSASRMIEHLQNNGGEGIICETEADAMSGAKKQDWGDYSPVLRAAFHHEKYAFSRKTNNEYIEIKEPKLAVCLSGTPAQVPRLIASAEDGLFSRFLFYAFKNEVVWLDPSVSASNIVLNDHFDNLSTMVLNGIDFLSIDPTEFSLTQDQWAKLNATFSQYLQDVAVFNGDDASAVVFRLGLVCFRIAMILSALRKCDTAELKTQLKCQELDFNTSLILCETFLAHSLLMYNNLPNQNNQQPFTNSSKAKSDFFEQLPQEFTRQQAIEIGKLLGLADRTIDSLLKNALGIKLEKIKAGHYRKINA